jgi:hypothetical protein
VVYGLEHVGIKVYTAACSLMRARKFAVLCTVTPPIDGHEWGEPNNINRMSVSCGCFRSRMMLLCRMIFYETESNDSGECGTDSDVNDFVNALAAACHHADQTMSSTLRVT